MPTKLTLMPLPPETGYIRTVARLLPKDPLPRRMDDEQMQRPTGHMLIPAGYPKSSKINRVKVCAQPSAVRSPFGSTCVFPPNI